MLQSAKTPAQARALAMNLFDNPNKFNLWDKTIGTHAAIRDTSEMMAVFPGGVRMDKRATDKDGVTGDATRASAERGEKLIELKVEAAVREIAAARASAPR